MIDSRFCMNLSKPTPIDLNSVINAQVFLIDFMYL